ncbi:MAG: hypothetical protein PHW76_03530 [Alphaproteobacteria bacterium]|nr:hypothetical protein [Alphaproteobacteria bacterium]
MGNNVPFRLIPGFLGACFVALAVLAAPQAPEPVTRGDVSYLSGGVSLDERQAIEAQAKNYNLLITNANRIGQMSVDANIVVKGKDGREVITIDNAGPLFYAKLPPGDYTITALSGDQQQRRIVKIPAKGTKRVYFTWQQD